MAGLDSHTDAMLCAVAFRVKGLLPLKVDWGWYDVVASQEVS